MKTALVPGSFDPVTRGHIRLIEKASRLFDKVYVTAMNNAEKEYLFSARERVALLRAATAHIKNVEVDFWDGMLWQYAEKIGACAIVKGVRNEADAAYELSMADYNAARCGTQTVLLPADTDVRDISSTAARSTAAQNGALCALVDGETEKALRSKYKGIEK